MIQAQARKQYQIDIELEHDSEPHAHLTFVVPSAGITAVQALVIAGDLAGLLEHMVGYHLRAWQNVQGFDGSEVIRSAQNFFNHFDPPNQLEVASKLMGHVNDHWLQGFADRMMPQPEAAPEPETVEIREA